MNMYHTPYLSVLSRSKLSSAILATMGVFALSFTSHVQANADQINLNNHQYDTNISVEQSGLYADCSMITSDHARLACYDNMTVVSNHQLNQQKKKQIDLDETFKSAFSGKPKLVIQNPKQQATQQKTSQKNSTKKSENTYFLNTEVIRTFYKTGNYQDPSKPIQVNNDTNSTKNSLTINVKDSTQQNNSISVTKSDKQITSEHKTTTDNLFVNKTKNKNQYSSLSRAYDLDKDSSIGLWKPRMHKPLYILPLFMHDKPNHAIQSPSQNLVTNTPNDYRSAELKFQFSLKSKVAQDLFDTDADMWFGYTQQSHWQVYNEDNSRPFRATDYMPELFLTQPVKANLPFGGQLRMLGVGAIHHSNGEDDPLSRSWNRVYLMSGAEWGKLTVVPRLWKRIKTKASSKDDNPDIEDYYGYGDLTLSYDLDKGRSVSGTFRYNPSTSNGAAQIDYIHPMDNKVNLYVNLTHGYGESIIDYNHKDTTLGIGVMLSD